MTNAEQAPREVPITDNQVEYLRLFGGKPDLCYLVGGGLVRSADGSYQLSQYLSPNQHGLGGGVHRMEAAAKLASVFPTLPIVSCGGNRGVDGAAPTTYARFVARELEERGVASSRIFEMPDAYTTSMELVRIIQAAGKLGEMGFDDARIVVVTNEIYIPRSELSLWTLIRNYTNFLPKRKYDDYDSFRDQFLKSLTPYAHSNIQILFSACEDMLSIEDPSFSSYYEEIKKTEAFRVRQKHERQGIEDLMVHANYNSRV